MKKTILITITVLLGTTMAFAQSPNYQGIIYVTPSGAGTHSGDSWANATSSIDTAQTLAQAHNAVVWVAAGTYYGNTTASTTTPSGAFTMKENVNVYGGFAGNEPAEYNLSLRDFENHKTILDGQHSRRVLYQPSEFNVLTVWDGFSICHGRVDMLTSPGAGAYIRNNGCLRNCHLTHNMYCGTEGTYYVYCGGGGVFMTYGSVLSNCLIANNYSFHFGGGVNGAGTIYNSTIVRNSAGVGGSGVWGGLDSNLVLLNCIVWGNKGSVNAERNVIGSYSAVEGGCDGDNIILLSENGLYQPLFANPSRKTGTSDTTSNTDWHLLNGSICINRGSNDAVLDSTDIQGNPRIMQDTVDIGCYESPYLGSALPTVSYHGIVYVTPTGSGSQTGENWSNATSSISLATAIARMNNADVWVAAGTYYGDTTTFHAFLAVEGVNVYGGFLGNEPSDFDLNQRNIEDNSTILDGQNRRHVLYGFNLKHAEWDGFTITHGRQSGGVNNVDYFTAGGVFFQFNGVLRHCKVSYNKGGNGGGISLNRWNRLENCLVSNNEAFRGGGIHSSYYDTIVNTTIVKNYSYYGGGGIYDTYGLTVLSNCLIWGNVKDSEDGTSFVTDNIHSEADITCSYSAVENGFPGVNNIPLINGTLLQPMFVNPSSNAGIEDTTSNVNWHLQAESICINRGDNDAVTDSMDLSGEIRIRRDTVDIGCYESNFYRSHVLFNEQTVSACDSILWNGNVYEENGDYTHTTTDANGYATVEILHLSLKSSTTSDITVVAPNSYEWNGNTYTQSGDYTWIGTAENGCDSIVTLHLTITVGVNDYDGFDFKVYPNPTTGIVNVQCTMNNVQVETMEILVYDAFGRLLRTTDGVETCHCASLQTDTHGSSAQAQIDLSRFSPGVYLLKVVADGNVVAVRKVVKR